MLKCFPPQITETIERKLTVVQLEQRIKPKNKKTNKKILITHEMILSTLHSTPGKHYLLLKHFNK